MRYLSQLCCWRFTPFLQLALLFSLPITLLLQSSPPLPISDAAALPASPLLSSSTLSSSSRWPYTQISPAGFASLMLGISMALMLCGSVTFIVGFILMPWVLGLVMLLYVVGVVSGISMLARALLFHVTALASPPPKDVPEWKLL